ncbi:MAG: hypothetical protein J0L70_26720 [Leptolyngbya sp. UWPOB_LEPTO1]|uniref:hypothetical protein n=1 Tax=Leptolyngbya sp. UWPOB_LEPTO1 TaxID=2815653 RepID=UPI001AC103CB|nr:hypothetical protein [Leptolyngbya sp. UWPOB_LEPTO1]MBN8564134.1 hypothetical protein [Leptolyngbya sp. UWPOB_LEPTO1]
MQQPIQNAYKRLAAIHSIYQLGLVGLALTLTCGSIIATQGWSKNRDSVRAACALLSIGLCTMAESERKDKKWSQQTSNKIDEVLTYNAAAWANILSRPSSNTLRVLSAQSNPPGTLELFDWSNLADPDEHPTLAIISPMGGGKSRLAKYLAKHVLFPGGQPRITAIDIYGRKSDWVDAELVTEHKAMLEFMESDIQEIESRTALYRNGQDNFQPKFTIFEEAPDTIGTLQKREGGKDLVHSWVTKQTTVARKVKSRLCIISVRLSGAEIGVSAEARNDATVIFPGKKGIAKAMSDDRIFKLGAKQNTELREQLQNALQGLDHPALIYSDGQWFPASVPELDNGGNPQGIKSSPLEQVQRLEKMFSLDCDSEPDRSELIEDTEPGWMSVVKMLKSTHSEVFDEVCKEILRIASVSNNPVTARQIHQSSRVTQKFSADNIRILFLLLEYWGKGVASGAGKNLDFRVI